MARAPFMFRGDAGAMVVSPEDKTNRILPAVDIAAPDARLASP